MHKVRNKYINAVSTALAPVGRAFGLKYWLADLLQPISRASSQFTGLAAVSHASRVS